MQAWPASNRQNVNSVHDRKNHSCHNTCHNILREPRLKNTFSSKCYCFSLTGPVVFSRYRRNGFECEVYSFLSLIFPRAAKFSLW